MRLTLYLVTDTALCGDRGVVATVEAAVAGGVTAVQLRDPRATTRELYDLAVALRTVLDGTGIPLIVNDRLDVALAAGAAGVHLGQSDLPVRRARELGGDLIIGLSVSTPDDVARANELPAGTVDYVGIGPVFATPTKPDAGQPLGVEGISALRAATTLSAVAIGGITPDNAAKVVAGGVDGICVVSSICAAADPAAAARALRAVAG